MADVSNNGTNKGQQTTLFLTAVDHISFCLSLLIISVTYDDMIWHITYDMIHHWAENRLLTVFTGTISLLLKFNKVRSNCGKMYWQLLLQVT